MIERGMTVIDIGANIGFYSLLAASRVGKWGSVQIWQSIKKLLLGNVMSYNILK